MKILDCTLRDGGYYTNWDFNKEIIDNYLKSINSLPIDYIEVGYRSKPKNEYYGEYFYCPINLLKQIKVNSLKKIAIMLNEKDVNFDDISPLLDPILGIVDMVRIAVDPNNLKNALGLIEIIKNMGFETGLNIMYMSSWINNSNFIENLKLVNHNVDYLNMVDSYGGVYPDDIRLIYNLVRSKTNVKIGFHGHNNLELALINSLTALDCGAEIVDVTVTGMGRGAGNLKTELFLTSLNAYGKLNFDFNDLSMLVDTFSNLQNKYRWGTNLPYMVSGANSLPQKDVMDWVGKRFYSFNSIIRALKNQTLGIKDNLNLLTFNPNQIIDKVIVIGGGVSGKDHSSAILEYLNNNLEIAVIHVSSKNVIPFSQISNFQIHCLSGNEGHRLESFFINFPMINKLAILPPFPRTMGTYIPEFFKDHSYQLQQISFTDGAFESVTAVAIQVAIEYGVKEIQFVGFDGYDEPVTENEMSLFNENEYLFKKLNESGVNFYSLTPTKYLNLKSKSIYSLI